MIIIEPMGGLANRMRVIASGITLSKKLGADLQVIWDKNYALNCPYNALFELSPLFSITSKKRKYNHLKSSNQPTGKWQAKVYNKLLNIDYCIKDHDFPTLVWPGKLDIDEVAKNHKRIYIQTCHEFCDNQFTFHYFKPIPQILESIQQVTKKFADRTIGVQVRRTDHEEAIKHSPVSLFIDAMNAELEIQKDTTFFLCSDDQQVKDEIISIFGDKIITLNQEVSRKTTTGVQHAVVDLFCLSKTSKILGSYYSSFPEVASSLGNIELKVIKNEIALNPEN